MICPTLVASYYQPEKLLIFSFPDILLTSLYVLYNKSIQNRSIQLFTENITQVINKNVHRVCRCTSMGSSLYYLLIKTNK